jgi:1-phosphatidylinositol-3-phosphate 5-kinase
MISEHKSAKLLILAGALEYHRVSSKLASIGTILEQVRSYSYAFYICVYYVSALTEGIPLMQEKEHLRKIVGKIEVRRPNVLLVEKTVSSYAQELLAKDISLVLNVKKQLLDRISRCTGAQIASSVDSIASVRLGQCEMFKVEKVLEFSSLKQAARRFTKTLMFFEGCPKCLGCTVMIPF